MKALSIRQPWPWAILYAGKDIENRDWVSFNPGIKFRGPFLIHASAGMTGREYEYALETIHAISLIRPFPPGLTLPAFASLPRGGIVGKAEIVDCVTKHDSPWFFGSYGLVIRNAEPLPFPAIEGKARVFRGA